MLKSITVSLKIIIVFIVVYLGIAYGFYAFNTAGATYSYKTSNSVNRQLNTIWQPIQEVASYGRVTHWYDWSEVSNPPSTSIGSLPIRTKEQGNYNIYKPNFGNSLLAEFKVSQEAVILEPLTYAEKWNLLICPTKSNQCLESNLLAEGKQKIVVDNSAEIWGKGINGQFIQLRIVAYIKSGEHREILFL